jgi:hypothetical protein
VIFGSFMTSTQDRTLYGTIIWVGNKTYRVKFDEVCPLVAGGITYNVPGITLPKKGLRPECIVEKHRVRVSSKSLANLIGRVVKRRAEKDVPVDLGNPSSGDFEELISGEQVN